MVQAPAPRTVAELISSPLWRTILQKKDELSLADMETLTGVRRQLIGRAFEETNVHRTPRPRGPRPQSAPAPEVPARETSPRDRALTLLGTIPDPEVAARVGVTAEEVKAWRKELGIRPFLRPPPQAAPAPVRATPNAQSSAAPVAPPATVVLRRRPDAAEIARGTPDARLPEERLTRTVPAPVAAEAAAVVAEVVTPGNTGAPAAGGSGVAASLEAFRHRLGKESDQVIAAESGVHHLTVGKYRRSQGIPAYTGHYLKGRVPAGTDRTREAVAPPSATVASDGRSVPSANEPSSAAGVDETASPLDAFRHRLGQESDLLIAAEAGVHPTVVGKYRRLHGIPAYIGHHLRRRTAAEPLPTSQNETAQPDVATALDADNGPEGDGPAGSATEVETPSASRESAATTGSTPFGPRPYRQRRSRMDAYKHLIGVATDAEVARLAGVTAANVTSWRQRHGIPSRSKAAKTLNPVISQAGGIADMGEQAARVAPAPEVGRSTVEGEARQGPGEAGGVEDEGVAVTVPSTEGGVSDEATTSGEAAERAAAPVVVPAGPAPEDHARPGVSALPPVAQAATLQGYKATAVAGERSASFIVTGRDMGEAVVTVLAALADRRDGPWTLRRLVWLSEALG